MPSPTPLPGYDEIERAVIDAGLAIYGALHPRHVQVAALSHGTLLLLGTDAAFWPRFTRSKEYRDAAPDPVDLWSTRVIGGLATAMGARAHYPFGGPPYAPFVNWALASGRCFTSPSQMMVHDRVGLMISLRGALHFDREFDIPPPLLADSPCLSCPSQPCLSACPVQALAEGQPYDLLACHTHLDSAAGASCMEAGCLARRACPISQTAGRDPDQTAHHMRYFHKT